jgi:hypothetical protein
LSIVKIRFWLPGRFVVAGFRGGLEKMLSPYGGLCAKIALSQSSRSVFVQASTSARKPIVVDSRIMRSTKGGVSKATYIEDGPELNTGTSR